MHWLGFPRSAKSRLEGNRYRKLYTLKYWILGLTIGMAILGTLQIGLLDPIALLTRSMTDAVSPIVDVGLRAAGFQGIHPSATPAFSGAVLIGVLFAALLLLNLVIPRFFCRVLCPLGALLGLFSRFALFRIHRDPGTCNGCNLCSKGCEGAAEPEATVRLSECMVCMNCVEDCPHGSITFGFLPPRERAVEAHDGRRTPRGDGRHRRHGVGGPRSGAPAETSRRARSAASSGRPARSPRRSSSRAASSATPASTSARRTCSSPPASRGASRPSGRPSWT